MSMQTPVIVCLSTGGYQLATELVNAMDNVEIHGLKKRLPDCVVTFENTIAHVNLFFAKGAPLLAFAPAEY